MYFSVRFFALTAFMFSNFINLHHVRRGVEDQERSHARDVLLKRGGSTIQQLETEVDSFTSTMTASLSSPNATTYNPAYIASVNGSIQGHQAWMKVWLAGAAGLTSLNLQVQQLQIDVTAFSGWTSAWLASYPSMDSASALSLLQLMIQTYEGWLRSWLWTAGPYGTILTSPPVATSHPSTHTTMLASQTVSFSAASTQTSSVQPSSSHSAFNPMATDNVMVYFGQTPQTQKVSLDMICAEPNVDIVVVAFVNGFYDNATGGGLPTVNFGPSICNPTTAMTDQNTTGLMACPDLAHQISGCQSAGKIVLLSLGGSVIAEGQSIDFANDTQAITLAGTLWNLFGAGTDLDPGLRPFGSVVIDGFDIDTEDKHPSSWSSFTTTLRTLYATNTSKPYYISGAPQCPFPDMSIPPAALTAMDFVWVQFYDNAAAMCDLGQAGFLPSFNTWARALTQNQTTPTKHMTMLYIMALAMSPGYGTGYVDIAALQREIVSVKALANVTNFGGVGLWDGSQAVLNGGFQDAVKGVLTGRNAPLPVNDSASTTRHRPTLPWLRL